MPCESHREALTEAAVTNAAPSRELRSHLDTCTPCSMAFAEEVQLFAAIETGLRAVANAEAPASLLPRVRAKLNESSAPRRSWIPAFASLAAAAALAVAVVLIRGEHRDAHQQELQTSAIQRDVAPPQRAEVPAVAPRSERGAPAVKLASRREAPVAPLGGAQDLAVLIAPGQKQAMDALLLGVQRGVVKPDVFLPEDSGKPLQELEVSPLAIAPIEIKPLGEAGRGPASPNEKTSR